MKQRKRSKNHVISSNEAEFNALMYMQHAFLWERTTRPDVFVPSGTGDETLKQMKMDGVVFLFENGNDNGPLVLTEKSPEVRYEKARKYFDAKRIPYWLMRRWQKKPDGALNLFPQIGGNGFCLFGLSEEYGHSLARKFGAESFILHVMDPHLRIFLIGTNGGRFAGMRRTLYRLDEPEEMIALQFVIYDSKLYHQFLEYESLTKELKQLQPAKRKRKRNNK